MLQTSRTTGHSPAGLPKLRSHCPVMSPVDAGPPRPVRWRGCGALVAARSGGRQESPFGADAGQMPARVRIAAADPSRRPPSSVCAVPL
jgi:hypothetical protein